MRLSPVLVVLHYAVQVAWRGGGGVQTPRLACFEGSFDLFGNLA